MLEPDRSSNGSQEGCSLAVRALIERKTVTAALLRSGQVEIAIASPRRRRAPKPLHVTSATMMTVRSAIVIAMYANANRARHTPPSGAPIFFSVKHVSFQVFAEAEQGGTRSHLVGSKVVDEGDELTHRQRRARPLGRREHALAARRQIQRRPEF